MPFVEDWSEFPNFHPDEFRCSHTGWVRMDVEFMRVLQAVRTAYGKPMRITSGYRDPSHPIEAAKGSTSRGEHTYGRCADVACEGVEAVILLKYALAHGITRIGVQQKGSARFLHLGIGAPGLANPWIWSY